MKSAWWRRSSRPFSTAGGAPGRARDRGARFTGRTSTADEHLCAAARDAFKRLIAPSIEREIRAELTEKAEEQALNVFRENLRSLLLQAPLRGHVVMGLDPAYRTGVKVAVVDPTGRLLATDVIYPTAPHNRTEEAAHKLTALLDKFGVTAVAIGNGTASRETEAFVAAWLKGVPAGRRPAYAIVDEAGSIGVLRVGCGPERVSRSGRQRAQRGVHRPAAAGPPGGAGQDRARALWAWGSISTTWTPNDWKNSWLVSSRPASTRWA